uniref:Uncharacterized protein n=1 Tax=Steinernema glaseri TaxID=37863 RepID=A0A1I7YNC9_9BILA
MESTWTDPSSSSQQQINCVVAETTEGSIRKRNLFAPSGRCTEVDLSQKTGTRRNLRQTSSTSCCAGRLSRVDKADRHRDKGIAVFCGLPWRRWRSRFLIV